MLCLLVLSGCRFRQEIMDAFKRPVFVYMVKERLFRIGVHLLKLSYWALLALEWLMAHPAVLIKRNRDDYERIHR